jgi:hypothetical protein
MEIRSLVFNTGYALKSISGLYENDFIFSIPLTSLNIIGVDSQLVLHK